jgi:hypothetical protein
MNREKTMNRIKNLIALGAFSLLVLSLPVIAMAQYNGQYDPYGRNGGYNNGGYGNNGYYGDIRSTLRDLKDRSKNLKHDIDHQNNGNYGGYYGGYDNRYLKDLANEFKKAADRLEDHYRIGRDQYKSSDDARRVLDLGSQLEQQMYQGNSNGYLGGEWNQINNDLRVVANTYGYNYNGNGNYRNNRGNRNNYPNNYPQNTRIRRPSWWPF